MTRLNQLCHQRQAAAAIIREQMERQARLDVEIALLLGVTPAGGYATETVEDFRVTSIRLPGVPAQVIVEEREWAGEACKQN